MNDLFQVLIIDEDQELCQTLSPTLADAGCRVECLCAAENPLAAIRELSPDLIILDISMSETPGLEILRRLKSHRTTRKLPVIATSRQAELEYELLDVFDFLSKPLDQQRLLEDIALLRENARVGEPSATPSLDKEELVLFQNFLVTHSGLHFDRRNLKILERGLVHRMRAVHVDGFRQYFAYLERFQESRQELKKLLGLLTIGETYFFRYLPHFDALIQHVVPEFIRRNRHQRTLRIWSAGCSSGEEPYSIAMALLEHFPELADWDVRILATDINKRSLRQARDGVFRPRALRVTDSRFRDRYFRRIGSSYVLDPRVRDMVRFAYLNLQTGLFPSEENGTANLDILMCRNVTIYFRLATTRSIVEKFSHCLRPGGYLFLGHAETLMGISDRFQRIHNAGGFYYRRRLEEEPPAEAAPPPVSSPPPKPVAARPAPVRPRPAAAPARQKPPVPSPPEPAREDPEELFREAEQAFNREDFKTAAENYDIILRRWPGHVGALVGKGFILANRGEFDQALDFCDQAIAVNDLCPEAYFLRGLILGLGENLLAAAAEYRKALLLDMDFIMPHYNLSKLYLQMNRNEEALRELRNTLRLLERAPDESQIPYSGGLSRAVFLEVCRDDAARFGET